MTSSTDFLAELNEALLWKEEIGIPALEQVEQLTNEIIYYMNQEKIYKSQLEILKNEMNEKLSTATNNENNKTQMLMETKRHLKHVSIENTLLSQRLSSMEMVDEHSQELNQEIIQLQKRNQTIKESNERYIQIIHKLTKDQTSNKQQILHLNTKINELSNNLIHMSDIVMDTKQNYRTVIEKTIAEKEEYIENANDEFCKCIQFAKKVNTDDDDDEFYSNQLVFQRTFTLSNIVLNTARVQSTSMISDDCTSPKIFSTEEYFPTLLENDEELEKVQSFTSVEEEEEQYINNVSNNVSKNVSFQSIEDEKQKEEECICNINIFEIEIESLAKKLKKYKNKFSAVNKKYMECKKDLCSMNILYDKLYAEQQEQPRSWFSFLCVS